MQTELVLNQQPAQPNEAPSLTRRVCAATAGVLSGSATAIVSLGTLGMIAAVVYSGNPVIMGAAGVASLYFGAKAGRKVNNQILGNRN